MPAGCIHRAESALPPSVRRRDYGRIDLETNEQGLLSSSREMPIRDLFAGDVKQHALPARMNFRRWSHALLAFLALTAYARTALPKSKTAIDITPGPSVMSDEEKAIQADPAQRIQHGVILLEEYERNENLGTDRSTATTCGRRSSHRKRD